MTYAVVGGWGADQGGRAPGLSVFRVDLDGRAAESVDVVPAVSPSFVLAHPDRPWVFAATEEDAGRVRSYALTADGRLRLLADESAGGAGPCHLALSPDGRHLVVAHYGSGAVTSFPVGAGGEVGPAGDSCAFQGSGPDRDRQQGPHAHQVLWSGDELLVCDLGTDRVHRLRLADGRFHPAGRPVALPPGCGPRHAAVVGGLLVVVCELSAEIWVGRRAADGWAEAQRLPLAAAAAGGPRCFPSGIATDGRRVFVANRGPDTLTELALEDGRLAVRAEHPCGGHTPRDVLLADGRLWVSLQDSDAVAVLGLDGAPLLEIPVASPTAVALVPSH